MDIILVASEVATWLEELLKASSNSDVRYNSGSSWLADIRAESTFKSPALEKLLVTLIQEKNPAKLDIFSYYAIGAVSGKIHLAVEILFWFFLHRAVCAVLCHASFSLLCAFLGLINRQTYVVRCQASRSWAAQINIHIEHRVSGTLPHDAKWSIHGTCNFSLPCFIVAYLCMSGAHKSSNLHSLRSGESQLSYLDQYSYHNLTF